MRMPIDIIGGLSGGRSLGNRQECINLYPVIDQTGNKAPKSLLSTPGSRPFVSFGVNEEVRGIQSMKGVLFAVVGNKFYRIDGVTPVELATIGTSSGPVFMEDNGDTGQVAICDGIRLYVWSDATLTDRREAQTMTYQNRYLIITEINKDIIRYSKDGGNFLEWDETDLIAADVLPDAVVCVKSDNNNLWVLGTKTVQPFYITFASIEFDLFAPISNATSDVGIGASHSLTLIDNTVFWLDDTARVRHAQGYTPLIISTDAITDIITAMPRYDDAIGMSYAGSGHEFYVLTFPAADLTIAYDIATGAWHQWSTGVDGGRHLTNCMIEEGGENIVGDYSTGELYKLDYGYFMDGTSLIKRLRAAKTIQSKSGNFLSYKAVELECRVGVGDNDGTYIEPKVSHEWSDDNGQTWRGGKFQSLGKIGKWKHRVKWFMLGRSRSRIPRWTITDPVQVEILGAWVEAKEGSR